MKEKYSDYNAIKFEIPLDFSEEILTLDSFVCHYDLILL